MSDQLTDRDGSARDLRGRWAGFGVVIAVGMLALVAGATSWGSLIPDIVVPDSGSDTVELEQPSDDSAETRTPPRANGPVQCMTRADCLLWEVDLRATGGQALVDFAHGLVVVIRPEGLVALDLSTGVEAWSFHFAVPDGGRGRGLVGAAGLVLTLDDDDMLHALRVVDGTPAWARSVPQGLRLVDGIGVERRLLVTFIDSSRASHQRAMAWELDASSGEPWREINGYLATVTTAGIALVDENGRLYVEAGDGGMRGPIRSEEVDARVGWVTGAGDFLLLAPGTGTEHRWTVYRASDGTELANDVRWLPFELVVDRVAVPSRQRLPMVIVTDTEIALIEPNGVAWRVELDDSGCCLGSNIGDDAVTLRLDDGSMLRLDRSDGAVLGREAGPATNVPASRGFLVGGIVFVAEDDTVSRSWDLRAFDARTGELVAALPGMVPLAAVDGGDVILTGGGRVARLQR